MNAHARNLYEPGPEFKGEKRQCGARPADGEARQARQAPQGLQLLLKMISMPHALYYHPSASAQFG